MAIKAIVNNVEKEIIDVKMISGGNELNAWEVRDQQNRLIWGKEGTISGQTPLSFKAGGVPLTGMTLYGNTVQTGTPTPNNPIMPTFCGKLIDTDWTIPITCAGQTKTVYLGQTQTVRRVKKLVLTGEENWTDRSQYPYADRFVLGYGGFIKNYSGYCTHYEVEDKPVDTYPSLMLNDGAQIVINHCAKGTITLADFRQFLRDQYTAGTPVTVWYVLATPKTAIVNEPLAKVGYYADELHSENTAATIPTVRGENTLTVDTNLQPSSITISGHII